MIHSANLPTIVSVGSIIKHKHSQPIKEGSAKDSRREVTMLKSLLPQYNTGIEKPNLYLLPDPKPVRFYPTAAMMLAAEEKNDAISNFKFITPSDFVYRWNIPQQKLTHITGAGLSVVKSWFDKRKVKPNFEFSYRLTRTHKTWEKKYPKFSQNLDAEPTKVMYDVVTILNTRISEQLIDVFQFCSEWQCNFNDLRTITRASTLRIERWLSGRPIEFEYSYRLTSVHKEWKKYLNDYS